MSKTLTRYLLAWGGFLLAFVVSAQEERYRLCIIVDGSSVMVKHGGYDAVCSALDTKLKVLRQDKVIPQNWDIEVYSVGLTNPSSLPWSVERKFDYLTLYLLKDNKNEGKGFDKSRVNNRIPGVKEDSALTHQGQKEIWMDFYGKRKEVYDGMVVISDQNEVKLLSNLQDKYHRNIIVFTTRKANGESQADTSRLNDDVNDFFKGFMTFVSDSKKMPTVSISREDSKTLYVGDTARFNVVGKNISSAVVSYGDASPSSSFQVKTEVSTTLEHKYATAGEFKVVLTGKNEKKDATHSVSVRVLPVPPAPVIKLETETTDFFVGVPSKIIVAAANIASATLDLGDGTHRQWASDFSESIEHTYSKVGTYTVLFAAAGALDSSQKGISIKVVAIPAVEFKVEQQGNVVLATILAAPLPTVSLDWGDGRSEDIKTGSPVKHVYEKSGTYVITMSARRFGKHESAVEKVTINFAPAVTLKVEKDEVSAGAEVIFYATVGGDASATLDFGDGDRVPWEPAYEKGVAHTYVQPGTYTAKLTATSKHTSESSEQSVRVDVLPVPTPPRLELKTDGGKFYAGIAAAKIIALAANVANATLDFGDGNQQPLTADMENGIAHVFSKPGNYTISLSGTGADDTVTKSITVIVSNPPAVSLKVAQSANTVTVSAEAYPLDRVSLEWGDGIREEVRAGKSVEHTYKKSGTYVIKLIATRLGIDESASERVVIKAGGGQSGLFLVLILLAVAATAIVVIVSKRGKKYQVSVTPERKPQSDFEIKNKVIKNLGDESSLGKLSQVKIQVRAGKDPETGEKRTGYELRVDDAGWYVENSSGEQIELSAGKWSSPLDINTRYKIYSDKYASAPEGVIEVKTETEE